MPKRSTKTAPENMICLDPEPYTFKYELTRERFQSVMTTVPSLTYSGLDGSGIPFTFVDLADGGKLSDEFQDTVNFVLRFCSPLPSRTRWVGTPPKRYKGSGGSYGIKHAVERFREEEHARFGDGENKNCYVSNGMVILVALLLGYTILPVGERNCLFSWNISEK